jgi:hypothetical protein
MLSFDERTLDRGLVYYDEATSPMSARPREASYCSCPVGVACKHLVAVEATALSDSLPPEEVAWRLEAGIEAEDSRVPAAPTDLARQQPAATESPPAADMVTDVEDQVRASPRSRSNFGGGGPQVVDREKETRDRLAFVIGPRYDYHPRINRERPTWLTSTS